MSTTTDTVDPEPERYSTARDRGDVVDQSGYHQPDDTRTPGGYSCGCSLDTDKGAYRDVSVRMPDGREIHYYHQTAVVVEAPDGRLRLSSGGYRTSTTKERINRYLPSGYSVRQEDFEWYLVSWDPEADFSDRERSREPFTDGMIVEP